MSTASCPNVQMYVMHCNGLFIYLYPQLTVNSLKSEERIIDFNIVLLVHYKISGTL